MPLSGVMELLAPNSGDEKSLVTGSSSVQARVDPPKKTPRRFAIADDGSQPNSPASPALARSCASTRRRREIRKALTLVRNFLIVRPVVGIRLNRRRSLGVERLATATATGNARNARPREALLVSSAEIVTLAPARTLDASHVFL